MENVLIIRRNYIMTVLVNKYHQFRKLLPHLYFIYPLYVHMLAWLWTAFSLPGIHIDFKQKSFVCLNERKLIMQEKCKSIWWGNYKIKWHYKNNCKDK